MSLSTSTYEYAHGPQSCGTRKQSRAVCIGQDPTRGVVKKICARCCRCSTRIDTNGETVLPKRRNRERDSARESEFMWIQFVPSSCLIHIWIFRWHRGIRNNSRMVHRNSDKLVCDGSGRKMVFVKKWKSRFASRDGRARTRNVSIRWLNWSMCTVAARHCVPCTYCYYNLRKNLERVDMNLGADESLMSRSYAHTFSAEQTKLATHSLIVCNSQRKLFTFLLSRVVSHEYPSALCAAVRVEQ